MRKFAANYLVTQTGIFLKNGILIAQENEPVFDFIDTKGDLREIAQLTFLNGILFSGFTFVKTKAEITGLKSWNPVSLLVHESVGEFDQPSLEKMIEIGIKVQALYPEMKMPEIINGITEALISGGDFRKENNHEIFLLTGTDLVGLHFTPKCKLKKIL